MGRWRPSTIDVAFALPGVKLAGTWEPDESERAAAWEMLVELSTRTSVADLADDEGLCRDALTSLHSLFDTTRSILRTHGPGVARNSGTGNLSFGTIAVRVLNDVLRPLLSEWHPRLQAHESMRPPEVSTVEWEQTWAHNRALREELRQVRPVVRQYVLVLAEAAGVDELATAVLVPNGGEAALSNSPGLRDRGRSLQVSLGFRPRHRMIRWFDPGVLVGSAWRLLGVRSKGAEARATAEVPAGPTIAFDLDERDDGEIWFDYVADLGDAFGPTMAVAWNLGRSSIDIDRFTLGDRIPDLPDRGLPRGEFLVMGGDEVYPYPSADRYHAQTTGPYAAALPPGEASTLLALPGNHDWLDGLTQFTDTFCTQRSHGGWETVQHSSWFSVRLSHGWWLWAFDTGIDGTVDSAQRQYFTDLADQLSRGDRVIVASPVPEWRLREKRIERGGDHEAGPVSALLSEILPDGVTAPLFLSGDTHVYAHYVQEPIGEGPSVHHVTSGGGGAFLHPTHNLAVSVPQGSSEPGSYRLRNTWPPRPISRHALGGTTRRLAADRQTLPLVVVLGLVHAAFAAALGGSMRSLLRADPGGGWTDRVRGLAEEVASAPIVGVGAALVIALCTFVLPRPNVAESLVKKAARRCGLLHGLAQALVFLLAVVVGGAVADATTSSGPPGDMDLTTGLLAGAVFGGVASTLVFAHYLRLVNQRYRIHDNEAFSGRHIRGYKHFVRLRVGADGGLRLFVVGLETVRPGWAEAIARDEPPPTTSLVLVDVIDVAGVHAGQAG